MVNHLCNLLFWSQQLDYKAQSRLKLLHTIGKMNERELELPGSEMKDKSYHSSLMLEIIIFLRFGFLQHNPALKLYLCNNIIELWDINKEIKNMQSWSHGSEGLQ